MNTNIRKLSTLAALMVAGAVAGQANAAAVTGSVPASADVVIATTTITSHTLTAAQGSIAAGVQNASITAANGEVKAGTTDVLAIKWDEAGCAVDTGNALMCTVSGNTSTNKAKFTLAQRGGEATLAAVPGAAGWYGNGTQADFNYVVTLNDGQTVPADTYTVTVDAGVVTN
ncbi:hypothetical protein ACNHUP_004476 [Serratia marcescens]